MYLTVMKLLCNQLIMLFVTISLLSYVSHYNILFFAESYFSGHTFALGTETFIPRSQWDVKHLVRNGTSIPSDWTKFI